MTRYVLRDHRTGVEGAVGPPQAAVEDRGASRVSDSVTACCAPDVRGTSRAVPRDPAPAARSASRRKGSGHLDVRCDDATLAAVRRRARRQGVTVSAWVRAVVRDALDARRTDEIDAAVAARVSELATSASVSDDAVVLARQIRPLAVNVNDLDRRARAGEPVLLGSEGRELVELLREVRQLLGDRTAS